MKRQVGISASYCDSPTEPLMISRVDTDADTLAAAIATVERALQEADAPHPAPSGLAPAGCPGGASVSGIGPCMPSSRSWPCAISDTALGRRTLRTRTRRPACQGPSRPFARSALSSAATVRAWLTTPHAGSPFSAAATNAAVVWCGASEERWPARRAFVAVGHRADGRGRAPALRPGSLCGAGDDDASRAYGQGPE